MLTKREFSQLNQAIANGASTHIGLYGKKKHYVEFEVVVRQIALFTDPIPKLTFTEEGCSFEWPQEETTDARITEGQELEAGEAR